LQQIKEVLLEAYARQELPFEKLVEELKPERDLSRNPLVQVLFVMQNTPRPVLELPEVKVSWVDLGTETSRFDVVLFVSEDGGQIKGTWLYNAELFERATIERMATQFERLLDQVVDPSIRVDSLSIDALKYKAAPPQRATRARRKAVNLSQLSQVKTRLLFDDQTLPLLIEPEREDVDLTEWAATNSEFVNTNLLSYGALLFRGFDVPRVPDFERFAQTLCPALYGEYGDLPREEMGGKVYGSTPYPADETILFHNESSHMHRWPMLIWFYCVMPSQFGGETPIVDCRKIYQALGPDLRRTFAERGLMYVRNFTPGLDVSWQHFFHTNERSVVEDYCKQAGIDFEWRSDGGLRTRQICPAIVKHPQTGEMVFFNQLQLHHVSCLAPAVRESLLSLMPEEDFPRNVYYGDGARIEDSVMDQLLTLYRQYAVTFLWQQHDIIMLNNMLVAHSRNPYVGERKIVVALGDVVSKQEIQGVVT
jgi:alpha-ketoglutarate-dependent taurine dioxygenase